MSKTKPWRFSVWINEGAFFHEPWLEDSQTQRSWCYDKIPPRIMRAMVRECQERGKVNCPEKLRLMVDYILERR